ncbi:MAG: bifunctional diaminohydroxyphosphoribosylaminopyrimidine deaminase/5-amino-6-(5-phosphoribosylamino)uracil reductase RibD [Rickettsiales bacterium]
MTQTTDHRFLLHAQRMASRGLGRTWPNPSVGCVLVKNGVVIAVAHTADGGRPHAETQTLALAGDAARGATAYVTLEPCAHHGHTPPCAQALIDAGVTRVVFGYEDPDLRVNGRGAAMLKAAGVETTPPTTHHSPLTSLYRGFFRRVRHGLPEVSLKIATSRDNHIADPAGVHRWLTGEQARAHGHMLRATHDAVVTGIGTVLADDPLYTVRLLGITRPNLIRVVVDRNLQLPLHCQLVRTAEQHPLWLLTTAEAVEHNASHATELRERGVVLQVVETLADPRAILTLLAAQGLNRVLVEAGAALTAAFMGARCVDTLHWYRAPMRFGNTGQAAPIALDTALQAVQPLGLVHHQPLGSDMYERYELKSCLPD